MRKYGECCTFNNCTLKMEFNNVKLLEIIAIVLFAMGTILTQGTLFSLDAFAGFCIFIIAVIIWIKKEKWMGEKKNGN